MKVSILPKITLDKPGKARYMELLRVFIYTFCFTGIIMHLNEYDKMTLMAFKDRQTSYALFFFAILLMTMQRVRLINWQSLVVTALYAPVAFLRIQSAMGSADLLPGTILNQLVFWIAAMIITDMVVTKRVRSFKDMNLWMMMFLILMVGLMLLNRSGRTYPVMYIYFVLMCFIPVNEDEWGRVFGSLLNAGVISFLLVGYASVKLNPHLVVEAVQNDDAIDPARGGRWYGYFLNIGTFGQFLGLQTVLAFLSIIRSKDKFGRFGFMYFASWMWLAGVFFMGILCGTDNLILGTSLFIICIIVFGFKKTRFPALVVRLLVMAAILLLLGFLFVNGINHAASVGFDPGKVRDMIQKTPIRLFPAVANTIVWKVEAFHNMNNANTDFITNPILMFFNYIGSSRPGIWQVFMRELSFNGMNRGGLMYRDYFAYNPHSQYIQVLFEQGILSGGLNILFFIIAWIGSIVNYVKSKKEIFFIPVALLPMMFGLWVGEGSTLCYIVSFISFFVLMPVAMNRMPKKAEEEAAAEALAGKRNDVRKKGAIGGIVFLTIVVLVLGGLLAYKIIGNNRKILKDGEHYMVLAEEEKIVPYDNGLYSSENIAAKEVNGRILVNYGTVKEEASKASWGDRAFLSFDVDGASEKDVLILEFTAESLNETPVVLNVNYGGRKVPVEVDRGKSRYYIPFEGMEGLRNVLFSFDLNEHVTAPVQLNNICMADYGKTRLLSSLKTGEYTYGEYSQDTITAVKDTPKASDIVAGNGYVYALYAGDLIVYRGSNLTEVGRLKGLGDSTGGLCISDDYKTILVASKGSGAYLVDVSWPDKPELKSHYSTLEYACAADFYGKYAFICNRYFGIEIVDISDLSKPKYVTRVQYPMDAEYQDCFVADGYLYASAISQKRVDIYDVHDLSDIHQVNFIETDGNPCGISAKDNVLYISTARNSTRKATYGGIKNYTTGAGCGMEIYDINNPEYPMLLALEKTDGRITAYPQGIYDVTIDGNYAYLSMLSGGLYIYDISDPSVPKRVSVINVSSDKDSELFKEQDPEKVLLPYDFSKELRGNITHTAVTKDGVFVLTPDMGIYKAPVDLKSTGKPSKGTAAIAGEVPEAEFEVPEGYQAEVLHPDGNIYALAPLEDRLFVAACGEQGIKVMDLQMHTICSLEPGTAVKDVKVSGDIVYAAESTGGFAIYKYENGLLTLVGRNADSGYNAYTDDIQVSKDGNFVLAHAGNGRYRLIDCTDPANPTYIKSTAEEGPGTMYFRNVATGLVDGKYLALSGSARTLWFDGTGKYTKDETNTGVNEWNGTAPLGNDMLVITAKGYKIIHPAKGEVLPEVVVDNNPFKGKIITDGNTVIFSEAHEGKILIADFSDRENPAILMQMDTPFVTDVPCVLDGEIYVPLRHDGIMKITKK